MTQPPLANPLSEFIEEITKPSPAVQWLERVAEQLSEEAGSAQKAPAGNQ